jgi:hypothetical protein
MPVGVSLPAARSWPAAMRSLACHSFADSLRRSLSGPSIGGLGAWQSIIPPGS